MQGLQQMGAANYQAALYKNQARRVQTQAELQSTDIRKRADQIRGQQSAMAGASGVDLTGSIEDVLDNTTIGETGDVWTTKHNADLQARDLKESARNAKQQGFNALVGSVFKGISGAAGSGFLDSFMGGASGGAGAGPAGMYMGGTGVNSLTGLAIGGV